MTDLNHVENMRAAQTKIHEGDLRWYVQTANNFVVRGPFQNRDQAQLKLDEIREGAYEEAREEELEQA